MDNDLYAEWRELVERIKDRLTGDDCAEIGLYDFENKVNERQIGGKR